MAPAPAQQNAGCGADDGRANRVVAYLRVSTDRQAEEGLGLDIQEDQIRAYLQRHANLKLVKVYRDKCSGSTLDRPALQELLSDCKQNPLLFSKVIIAKLDRIARDTFLTLWIEKELKKANCELHSVAEPGRWDDPAQRIFLQLISSFAEFERSRITRRLLDGRLKKLSAGGYAGGRPCTGFVARDGKLCIDPEGAKLVRRIRQLRLARMSFEKIARRLLEEGFRPKGKRFYASGIHRLLRCPTLKGQIRYGGAPRPGAHEAIR